MLTRTQDPTGTALSSYSTCDISDALLKLGIPTGGFLPGLSLWSPHRQEGPTRVAGPAYTVKFVKNHQMNAPVLAEHYIDTVPAGSIIFISAPTDIPNAVYRGLMTHRARFSGAIGTVVDGNFRDLEEHKKLSYPVFARDVATPAFYEVARASEVNVPVTFHDSRIEATISPGDRIVGDLNGVICVPMSIASQVVELLPQLGEAESRVEADIDQGVSFAVASKKHRRKRVRNEAL